MKLYQIMKRGAPKELAPLLDWHWTTDYSAIDGVVMGMALTFARSESGPFFKGARFAGSSYELRFQKLEDFEVMRKAIDAMEANWHKLIDPKPEGGES